MKVIKKMVCIGKRENEGMQPFLFLFLQTFVVIFGQSCSEQQKNCAFVRVCLNLQSIMHVWMMRGLGTWQSFDTTPNAVHEQLNPPAGLTGERSRRAGKLLKVRRTPDNYFQKQ